MTIEYRGDIAGKICSRCKQWQPLTAFARQVKGGRPIGDGYKPHCTPCHNALCRAYYTAHREIRKDKQRAYNARHRERQRDAAREYRIANRDHINAFRRERRLQYAEGRRKYNRAYYAAHKEKLQADQNARYTANPERVRAATRNCRSRNRAKAREFSLRRRARKNLAEGLHTEAEWEALKARYDYTCLRCGLREPEITLTRDHIVPLIRGGSDWITNIQPLCGPCNSSKSDKAIDYRNNWTHKIEVTFDDPLPSQPYLVEREEK